MSPAKLLLALDDIGTRLDWATVFQFSCCKFTAAGDTAMATVLGTALATALEFMLGFHL
jgi:hypothetical protein